MSFKSFSTATKPAKSDKPSDAPAPAQPEKKPADAASDKSS